MLNPVNPPSESGMILGTPNTVSYHIYPDRAGTRMRKARSQHLRRHPPSHTSANLYLHDSEGECLLKFSF